MLLYGAIFGQFFSYPVINSSAKQISEFVPAGWIILAADSGDLNNDGFNDHVLVIQHKDSVTIQKCAGDDCHIVTTQPRILVIVLYDTSAKNYKLAESSSTFIPDHDDPRMDDPFQGISIEKRVIKIELHLWYSMGSWYTSSYTYKFRYNAGKFELIGAEYYSLHRASGDTEARSYDFLTRKRKLVTGKAFKDKAPKSTTRWATIKLDYLKTLKTFNTPFTWTVEGGIYL